MPVRSAHLYIQIAHLRAEERVDREGKDYLANFTEDRLIVHEWCL